MSPRGDTKEKGKKRREEFGSAIKGGDGGAKEGGKARPQGECEEG
jgi:hypothetical protein